jgi:hypothetical protein
MLNQIAVGALIALAGIAACAPVRSEAPTVPLNMDFDVAIGGMARLQDSQLLVRFDTVTEDSRCPEDVECVWEGNATARVTVDSAGKTAVGEFRTSQPQPVSLFGRTFELRELRPARTTRSVPTAREYVITLRATN